MAAPPIKLKRSGTTTATPSSLEYGELAINYADGVVFYRDSSDVIQSFTLQAYALSSHTHAASDITSGTLDAARIANDSITYAKLQNVSATDRLLGRSSAGAGDVEEVTCTAFGRSLIDDADAAAARTTLGAAPTASPTFSNAVTISAGNGLLDGLGNLRIFTTDTQAIDKGGQIGLGGANGFGAPFDPWAFGVIKGAKENGTSGNFSGYLAFGTANAGGTISERLRIKSTGESEFTGSVVANNSGNVVPLTVTNTGTANSFVVNDASGDTSPFVIDASGNVGIGTPSPAQQLHVAGGNVWLTTTDFVSGSTGTVLTFYRGSPTGNTYGAIGSLTSGATAWDTLVLNAGGGNVGIGTTTPGGRLEVAGGQLLVTAGSGSAGSYKPGIAVSGDDDTGIAQVGASPANTLSIVTNGSERVRVDASGNTCIGSAGSSAAELSVFKDKNAGRTSFLIDNLDQRLRLSCYYESGVDQYAEIQSATDSESSFQNLLLQRQGGDVLIGTTTDNGAYKLQVNSQIYATNATIATSDARFKANVESLTDATAVIEALRPVAFDFIPHAERNFATERQVGLIAQEAQSALAGTDYADSVVAQCGDHLGLAYEKLVPVLIRALQESNARIAALEEKLNHA